MSFVHSFFDNVSNKKKFPMEKKKDIFEQKSYNKTKNVIEVKNLFVTYGKKIIFDDVNFCLEYGSFTALCGKNGSGKSTLLSLLDGIIPDGLQVSGEILIGGKNVFAQKRSQIATQVSYLIQSENPIWNMTVRAFIETGLYSFSKMNKSEIDFFVNKTAKSLNLENLLDKKIFNISGGEFQKCRLARCLVQDNNVFLFDEPAENLDLPFQIKLLELLKNQKKDKTVLFSIHDINTAALFAENYLLVSDKKIITGTTEKIFDTAILTKAFELSAKIYVHPEFLKPQVCFLLK